MTLAADVDLINKSGTNIAISEYQLIIPVVKLKQTKITKVTPDVFLIDTFQTDSSNQFNLKASQLKSVVLRNGNKVSFSFTAELDKPFTEIGALRIFDLPFQLNSDHRTINIKVVADKNLPIVMAPKNGTSDWNSREFTVSDDNGKSFGFMDDNVSIIVEQSTNRAQIHPIWYQTQDNCIHYEVRSCENCDKGVIDDKNNMIFETRDSSKPIKFTSEISLQKACLTDKFEQVQSSASEDPAKVKQTRIVGVVLFPDINSLIPTEWIQKYDTKSGLTWYDNKEFQDKKFSFSQDTLAILHIPMAQCTSDTECDMFKTEIANTTKNYSLGDYQTRSRAQLIDKDSLSLQIIQRDSQYGILAKNKANYTGIIKTLELADNELFSIAKNQTVVIPSGSNTFIPLISKNRASVRNITTSLPININGTKTTIEYIPIQNTLLDIIYILSIVFVFVFGIFLLSLGYLVVYNRYAKNK